MRNLKRYILPCVLLSILLTFIAIPNFATNQKQAASPLQYTETLLSQDDWFRYGREMAQFNGMVREPTREEGVLMTFGSYLTLTGNTADDPRLPRENPVFVYQVFGNVPELTGFGSASGRRDIKGFRFVFDAKTGSYQEGAALPKNVRAELDLNFIPADVGVISSLQREILPTAIPTSTN